MSAVSISSCLQRAPELREVSESGRLDTEVILAWVFNRDRTFLYTWPEKMLTSQELAHFNKAFDKRLQGMPVSYITGEREFWSLSLNTNSSTLIPRPDTEVLVEFLVDKIQVLNNSAKQERVHILDLGTGTGAIALALASEFQSINVDAVDYSYAAVRLAKENVNKLSLSNVSVWQSDWFSHVDKRYQFIVSNPPYIDVYDEHLTQGDVQFEPRSALVSEEEGLKDIRLIAENAINHLDKSGMLVVEHGWRQALAVRNILLAQGYSGVASGQDYGGNDRYSYGTWASGVA